MEHVRRNVQLIDGRDLRVRHHPSESVEDILSVGSDDGRPHVTQRVCLQQTLPIRGFRLPALQESIGENQQIVDVGQHAAASPLVREIHVGDVLYALLQRTPTVVSASMRHELVEIFQFRVLQIQLFHQQVLEQFGKGLFIGGGGGTFENGAQQGIAVGCVHPRCTRTMEQFIVNEKG